MKLSSKAKIRIVVAILAVAATVIGVIKFGDQLTLENFIAKEAAIDAFREENLPLFFLAAFGVYVVITALSIPGAALLTILSGRFLGLGLGILLVSFASTLAATIAFLLSRFVIGDSIREKYEHRLVEINKKLEKEGPFYLFSMRLIPVIPFFMINLLMGLTPIKTWTFWWISQLGMLAGTTVYVYAGSQLPSLSKLAETGGKGILSPGLIIAFTILAIFPFIVRKIMSKIPPKESQPDP